MGGKKVANEKKDKTNQEPKENTDKPKARSKTKEKPKEENDSVEETKTEDKENIKKKDKNQKIESIPEETGDLSSEEAAVFEYMLNQNRPYSALNVFDNLRGAVKKAQCQKILDKLVEAKKIQAKEFGKAKIYLVNQSLIPVVSEAELDQMDNQIKDQTEQLELIKTEIKELQMQAKGLENSLSIDEINDKINELESLTQNLNNEISELKNQGCVTEEMRKNAEDKLKYSQTEEKKRLRIFNSLISGICEMMDMPKKKVIEMIGID